MKYVAIVFLPVLLLARGADCQTSPIRVASLTGNVTVLNDFESKILVGKRRLVVYLPPNYASEPKRKFPVLYMHDGQNIFDGATSFIPNQEWQADEAAEALINAGMIEPVIIVGIDNGGAERANEYLPTAFSTGRGDMIGGKANLYYDMISKEIMPRINKSYRTKVGPQNTGLCGSSFGGVATFVLGISHPETFGKLGVVSPSLWVNELELIAMTKRMTVKTKSKIWLDMGTAEGADSVAQTNLLVDSLTKLGWQQGKDLQSFIDPRAAHNEQAWARRFPLILRFLFGRG